jgi:hypothetical protein
MTEAKDIVEQAKKVVGYYNFEGLRGTPEALVALGDLAALLDDYERQQKEKT